MSESELTDYLRTILQSGQQSTYIPLIYVGPPPPPNYVPLMFVGPPPPPNYHWMPPSPPPHHPIFPTGGEPERTRSETITSSLVSLITMKQAALKLPETSTKNELVSAADRTVAEVEDSYCGTPPKPLPSLMLALALGALASCLEEGGLRTAILQEAGKITQKAVGVASLQKGAGA